MTQQPENNPLDTVESWERYANEKGLSILDEIKDKAESETLSQEVTEWITAHKVVRFRAFYEGGDCNFVLIADDGDFIVFSGNDMGTWGADKDLGFAGLIKFGV